MFDRSALQAALINHKSSIAKNRTLNWRILSDNPVVAFEYGELLYHVDDIIKHTSSLDDCCKKLSDLATKHLEFTRGMTLPYKFDGHILHNLSTLLRNQVGKENKNPHLKELEAKISKLPRHSNVPLTADETLTLINRSLNQGSSALSISSSKFFADAHYESTKDVPSIAAFKAIDGAILNFDDLFNALRYIRKEDREGQLKKPMLDHYPFLKNINHQQYKKLYTLFDTTYINTANFNVSKLKIPPFISRELTPSYYDLLETFLLYEDSHINVSQFKNQLNQIIKKMSPSEISFIFKDKATLALFNKLDSSQLEGIDPIAREILKAELTKENIKETKENIKEVAISDPFFKEIQREIIKPLQDREERLTEKEKQSRSDYTTIKQAQIEVERVYNTAVEAFVNADEKDRDQVKERCKQKLIEAISQTLIEQGKLKKSLAKERPLLNKMGRVLVNALMHIYVAPALQKWSKSGRTYMRITSTNSEAVAKKVITATRKLKPSSGT